MTPVLDELDSEIDIQVENGRAGQSKKMVTTPRTEKWEKLNKEKVRSNLGRLGRPSKSKTPKKIRERAIPSPLLLGPAGVSIFSQARNLGRAEKSTRVAERNSKAVRPVLPGITLGGNLLGFEYSMSGKKLGLPDPTGAGKLNLATRLRNIGMGDGTGEEKLDLGSRLRNIGIAQG